MPAYGPLIAKSAKLAVTYGPHVKKAAETVIPAAQSAARKKLDDRALEKQAFTKCATVHDGTVLRLVDQGQTVYLVLSAGDPIESYPPVDGQLDRLLRSADLSKALTLEEWKAKKVRARASRVGRTVAAKTPLSRKKS